MTVQQQASATEAGAANLAARTDLALEVALISAFELDFASDTVWRSPTTFRLLGFDPAPGRPDRRAFRARVVSEDAARENAMPEAQGVERAPHFSSSFRYRLPSGEERWIANHLGLGHR